MGTWLPLKSDDLNQPGCLRDPCFRRGDVVLPPVAPESRSDIRALLGDMTDLIDVVLNQPNCLRDPRFRRGDVLLLRRSGIA